MKRIYLILAAAVLLAGGKVLADGTNADFTKPAWLTDCSLGVKESYDDNVFLSGVDANYLPATYVVPPGSVVALKDRSSWITTFSPKVGVNFAPLIGATNLSVLSLAYAPDFVLYHDQPSESYNAHRLLAAVKATTEPVSLSADNSFVYIDGNDMGPVYPGALYSAFATTADRERRKQIQDRANVSVQLEQGKWFVRPTASLLFYNLMTAQLDVPGYQNYADRYDVNGGVDVGCKIFPQAALTLGYRYGSQYQQQYAFSPYSSSSDYQRVLLGVEGSLCSWLSVKIQGGPDFRNYAGDTATHTTPVNDRHPVKYYGEGSATATLAPENTLTLKYKMWQWVSGSGKVPYYEGAYELAWHTKLTEKLGFDLGGKVVDWDFSSGNLPTCKRNDLQYSANAGLSYAVNARISINLGCSLDWGYNEQGGLINPKNREFDRQMISLGTQWRF
jgi:hypothetical protein